MNTHHSELLQGLSTHNTLALTVFAYLKSYQKMCKKKNSIKNCSVNLKYTHSCSINGKNVKVPPLAIADANTVRPSGDENDIDEDGSCLR